MLISVTEKDKDTGRFKNVENYKVSDFKTVLREAVLQELEKVSFFDRMFKEFSIVSCEIADEVVRVFRRRLEEDRD